jgi:hypothetical protein
MAWWGWLTLVVLPAIFALLCFLNVWRLRR